MAAQPTLDARFVVYALSVDGVDHRYVGFTGQRGVRARMASHRHAARTGRAQAVYEWMREVRPENVVAAVLEKLPQGTFPAQLGKAEADWILQLKLDGYSLLNGTPGGLGTSGPMTPARLTLHSEAMRRAAANMTPEQRLAKAERARQQGTAHLRTPDALAKKAEAATGRKRGSYNWTAEGLQQKARGGQHGAHLRWHTGRGIVKDGCSFCAEDGETMIEDQK